MFSKSLKKKQKLALILRQIGPTSGKTCLLVTNGDNNGALNYHFRAHGGEWTWVENEDGRRGEMERFLGEPVLAGSPTKIPVGDASFDVVVAIDVHEHLEDPAPFGRELKRVLRPGGKVVVSTPTGDARKPLNLLKDRIGMTRQTYGHVVIGYDVRQHECMLRDAGLEPRGSATYSGFFTEALELAINFAYVKLLSRGRPEVEEGTIAPSTEEQLKAVEKQVRLYSAIYPVLWAVSQLDRLLFFLEGYAVSVVGRRPEAA